MVVWGGLGIFPGRKKNIYDVVGPLDAVQILVIVCYANCYWIKFYEIQR